MYFIVPIGYNKLIWTFLFENVMLQFLVFTLISACIMMSIKNRTNGFLLRFQ